MLEILKGLNGTIELNRLSVATGAFGYVFGALGFQAWGLYHGQQFDITAFCLAFGPGFAALGLGGAGAIAIKDRNVATSQVIAATGSKPATPPAPAPTPQSALADDDLPEYAR